MVLSLLSALRLATVAFSLLALATCDEKSPAGPTVSLDQRFMLAPKETAVIQGRAVRLQFDSVSGDSRCPADAVCIQGGDAIVLVRASGDSAATILELHTGDTSRATATYGGVRVRLVELQPYPFSSRAVAAGDYRATLVVSAP
jgi:hypothetical protein